MMPAPHQEPLASLLQRTHGFDADDLAANRAGRLTPRQVSMLRSSASTEASSILVIILIALGLPAVPLVAFGPGIVSGLARGYDVGHDVEKAVGMAIAFGLVALVPITVLLLGRLRVARMRDAIQAGRVVATAGILRKKTVVMPRQAVAYWLEVGGASARVSGGALGATPEGSYCMYTLPPAHELLSIEPWPPAQQDRGAPRWSA